MGLFSSKDGQEGLRCYPPNETVALELLSRSYCLLYGIPSLILYVLVLISLRRNFSSYSPTFVHLFSLSCLFNIGCWSMEFLFSRVFNVSHWCHFLVSLTATYFLVPPFIIYQFFPLASFVCCVLIALYQTNALVSPLDIEKKWSRRPWLLTCLTLVLPFIGISHLIFAYTTVMPLPSGKIYVKTMHWNDWFVQLNTPAVNSLFGAVAFVIILVCTTISVFRLFQLRKKNDKRVQIRVFLVIFLMSITSLIFSIYQVWLFWVRAFQDNYSIADVIQWREFVVDVCYLPLPWVVILVNGRIRSSLLLPFGRKQKQKKMSTWATTITAMQSSPRGK